MLRNDLKVFYAHTITPFMIYIVQSLVVSFFLLFFSVKLALVALIIYIVIGLVYPLSFRNVGQDVGENYRRKLTQVNNNSSEEAYGILKHYNMEKSMKQNVISIWKLKNWQEVHILKINFLVDLNVLNVVTYNIGVLAFIYVASSLDSQFVTVSLVAMFIVSFIPILYMGNLASTLSQTMASGKRFLELMNTPEEAENSGVVVDFNELKVDNLTYRYADNTVVDNLSFDVKKGGDYRIKWT